MILKDYIWSKFSAYYAINDNFKDSQGKGLFQRYLSIFGLELDENIIPAIEGLINNINPETAANELLAYISYSVGTPDDILGDEDIYRDLLIQVISIYQVKGTFRSYRLLFAVLGYEVQIEELFLTDNKYDIGNKYDTGVIYDDDPCSHRCISYNLLYNNIPGKTTGPLTSANELKLITLIKDLIEPHSAVLLNLTFDNGSLWNDGDIWDDSDIW